MDITIKEVKRSTNASSKFYIVLDDGREIGFLEKFKVRRGETHPWKAFGIRGGGVDATKFKAFYKEDGGKNAAIKQVQEWDKC